MTDATRQPFPPETNPTHQSVDELVRRHLDRLAGSLNATMLIERVCHAEAEHAETEHAETVPHADSKGFRSHAEVGRRSLAWIAATALALAIAFFSGRALQPSSADAATVLRDVRAVHSQPLDRCYRVQFAPNADYWEGRNPLRGPSDTLLWTRSDRFWADAQLGTLRLVYGRDERGTLWMSPSRSEGIRLSHGNEPLPADISLYCTINSLTVPALLTEVLADFDLRTDGGTATGGVDRSVIWARLKPGRSHRFIESAVLEVDRNDTLARLILWTLEDGKPRGTVTFTLVETARLDDDAYRLQSHLNDDARIRIHPLDASQEEDR